MGAVAQITDRGHSVKSVSNRLGVCTKSLYDWMKLYGIKSDIQHGAEDASEIKQLKAELRRVTEERDILKKIITAYFARGHG